MKKKFTFLFAMLSTVSLAATIVEIDRFEEISQHLTEETLVILDIDNTLIEPIQELGSDQWFYSQIHHYESQGLDTPNALEKALSEWMAVQNITQVRPVEESTPSLVHKLQERGMTVMGMTARGLGLSTRTVEQLKSVGIDLSVTSPTSAELFFMNDRGVLYRGGIVFTSGTHRGSALFKFLHEAQCRPTSILFINDKKADLVAVEQFAANHQIPFIGLRYGFLDEKVRNLDRAVADVQMQHFGKILSNDEAKQIARQNTPGIIR